MTENSLEIQELKYKIQKFSVAIEKKNLSNPKKPRLDKILDQRHFQRRILFWFALISAMVSMVGLFFIIGYPIYLKLFKLSPIELFTNKYELAAISTGVFAQFISVIIVITKSLWDDTPYKDSLREQDLEL